MQAYRWCEVFGLLGARLPTYVELPTQPTDHLTAVRELNERAAQSLGAQGA
jgi:hypothetical protein